MRCDKLSYAKNDVPHSPPPIRLRTFTHLPSELLMESGELCMARGFKHLPSCWCFVCGLRGIDWSASASSEEKKWTGGREEKSKLLWSKLRLTMGETKLLKHFYLSLKLSFAKRVSAKCNQVVWTVLCFLTGRSPPSVLSGSRTVSLPRRVSTRLHQSTHSGIVHCGLSIGEQWIHFRSNRTTDNNNYW